LPSKPPRSWPFSPRCLAVISTIRTLPGHLLIARAQAPDLIEHISRSDAHIGSTSMPTSSEPCLLSFQRLRIRDYPVSESVSTSHFLIHQWIRGAITLNVRALILSGKHRLDERPFTC
jgi:hypothetical protein